MTPPALISAHLCYHTRCCWQSLPPPPQPPPIYFSPNMSQKIKNGIQCVTRTHSHIPTGGFLHCAPCLSLACAWLPDPNQFVLYTKGKWPSKNLNTNLQSAWKDIGLVGVINFTLIRTAVATYYAKKSQNPKDRRKVADFMCHDTRTADKFYVANPDHCEAEEVRALVSQSLHVGTSGDKEKKQQQQEEEEEMEVGVDVGEGGSSSSIEEDKAAHSSSSANPPPQEVEEEGTPKKKKMKRRCRVVISPFKSIPDRKTTTEQSKQRMRVKRLRFPPKKYT
ncbi:uncharacterized protein LOC124850043 [Scophthalmus maximus]|uniref:uncharacterized protein LOC124850043 n=1 Tax=Scophthalmus maximus TaxID=52904 RepID=UPI001FA8F598|nr:uncharacterized protein LOC124850043 [Scophthalmus maximus]